MMKRFLLCTDLDRTLIPNGPAPPWPAAKALFGKLATREEICLAYVTGRHRALIEDAIAEFDLPSPDFAIADVGASIYEVSAQGWRPWRMWLEHIAPDWRGLNSENLRDLLRDIPELQMQEKEKQAPFKLSYYVPLDADSRTLIVRMHERLQREGIRANLIWSIDELAHIGLLDVLPQSAGKLQTHLQHFAALRRGDNLAVFNVVERVQRHILRKCALFYHFLHEHRTVCGQTFVAVLVKAAVARHKNRKRHVHGFARVFGSGRLRSQRHVAHFALCGGRGRRVAF